MESWSPTVVDLVSVVMCTFLGCCIGHFVLRQEALHEQEEAERDPVAGYEYYVARFKGCAQLVRAGLLLFTGFLCLLVLLGWLVKISRWLLAV
jgi:hypothetical protein